MRRVTYSFYWQDGGEQIGDLEDVRLGICPRPGDVVTFSTDVSPIAFEVQVVRIRHGLVTLDGTNFNGKGIDHQVAIDCAPITGGFPDGWAEELNDELRAKVLGHLYDGPR